MKPQRSPLWRFFSAINNELAICNLCKHKLSYKTSTSNLKRHMKSKHPTVSLDIFARDDQEGEVYEPPSKVPRMSSAALKLQDFLHESKKPSSCPKLCELSKPGTSTGSTHIPSDHNGTSNIMAQDCPSQPTSSFSISGQFSKQKTLVQCIPKKMSMSQKAKTDEALMKLFIKDFQPFSILEDEGFVAYSNAMNPSYELPNRKTISKTFLPAKFEEVLTDVKSKINEAVGVCLTTDSWTSINTDSFVAVTAHYIDNNFELQSVLLQCEQFSGHHTSENISKSLKELVEKWGLDNKVVLVVTDNASNITKAITDLKWKHFGCFAHSLNLAVKDALNADRNVVQLVEKIRKVVSHYKRSTNSTEKLMAYQRNNGKNHPKKLIQDVPTRWNSTYFMLRRFILLQEPLKATMALIDKDLPVLTTAEWKIACELMTVLKSFFFATNTMSGENYATASLVIPLSLSLASICKKIQAKTFSNESKNVVTCLAKGVKDRFGNVEFSQSLTLATFLDPGFKNVVFSSENVSTSVKQRVVGMISAITKDAENEGKQHQDEVANLENETQESRDELSIWTDLDDILAKKKKKGTHYSRAIVEVDRYLEDDLLDRKQDPIVWWKENGHQYPNLLKIAQKHFCCLATSVPCERAFSKAGLFITERRNRLSPNKTKMLMFLNHNEPSTHSGSTNPPRSRNKNHDEEEKEMKDIVDTILKQ